MPPSLYTSSLESSPHGSQVVQVMQAALQAVDPAAAVRQHLQRNGERLHLAGVTYDLSQVRRILLVGAGKAGTPMAQAAASILGDRLSAGAVIVKEGYAGHQVPDRVEIIEAGHPLPDDRGIQGAQCIRRLLAETSPDDLVLCLISGGGSALLVSPAGGLSLSDLQSLTSALLACGATINEINALRKHLDSIKGGGLARLAAPARLAALILSDVVGDPLDVIASGPTVPDSTTYAEAYAVIERYAIQDEVPPAVLAHLRRGLEGELLDTPKPGDPLFNRVQNVVIGSNRQAALAALEQARLLGMNALLLTTYLQGEARQAGRMLGSILRQVSASGHPIPRPACIICGGETTVTLRGKGLGGRNQELALGAVSELAGLSDAALVALATDGGDGPTDAAGAVVTGQTRDRARQLGLHPAPYLDRNDAYHFFEPLGDLLKPGPTQTNVNDLTFLFAF